MSDLRLRYAATSDVGRVRKDNQDSGYAGPWLIAVCDGVGGAARELFLDMNGKLLAAEVDDPPRAPRRRAPRPGA